MFFYGERERLTSNLRRIKTETEIKSKKGEGQLGDRENGRDDLDALNVATSRLCDVVESRQCSQVDGPSTERGGIAIVSVARRAARYQQSYFNIGALLI